MAYGGGGAPGQVDWLSTGPAPGSPRSRRRRHVLGGALVAAVVVALFAPALVSGDRPDDVPQSLPTPTPTPAPSNLPTRSAPTAGGRPLVVHDAGPFVRGLTNWELFARSDDTVYRIELGSGRVTATRHEPLGTAGPVTFLAGPEGVILRPAVDGPGVAVPDGRRARPLRGALQKGGHSLPGPPGFLWVGRGPLEREPTAMRLFRFDGTATRTSVAVTTGYFRPDGAGGLLLEDAGGVWAARPGGFRRITTGRVIAVGPRHHLLVSCDARHSCRSSVYDRRTHQHHRLGPGLDVERSFDGAISPDGRYAALLSYGDRPQGMLQILDLRGSKTVLRIPGTDQGPGPADVLWSPDGQWLAHLAGGRLTLIDMRTDRRLALPVRLPYLVQLIARPRS